MAAHNDDPKIPSFKPTRKDEKKGAGGPLSALGKPASSPSSGGGMKWPTFGKTGGGLKLRGMPGGATIMERLRNLRKKDMAFIAAGLSVLLMAPLAEHFLMNPEDEAGGLTQGFDQKGPLFPDGTSIYESGTGGFSPGSLIGQGTDVITPLNVRDPAALVMGPGATQKPAAGASASPPKPGSKKKRSWKDALKQAAGAGTKKAIRKGKLPRPNVKLAGALRGLNALSGASKGGGPSMKLNPLSASNVPNRARASGSLQRGQAIPGYRGAARRSDQMGGGPESLKAAGSRQGDIFNKGGGANALDTAAHSQVPGGGGYGHGGGGPGQDGRGKGPGGNTHKDNRSLGESLAFIRAKMEMEKAIALKWKKKEWNEFGKKKMIEEALYKVAIDKLLGEGLFAPLGKWTAGLLDNNLPGGAPPKGAYCYTSVDPPSFYELPDKGDFLYRCMGASNGTIVKINRKTQERTPYSQGGCVKCGNFGGADAPKKGKDPRRDYSPSELAGTKLEEFMKNCAKTYGATSEVCKKAEKLLTDSVPKLRSMEEHTDTARDRLSKAYAQMVDGNTNMQAAQAAIDSAFTGVAIKGGKAENVEFHGAEASKKLKITPTPDLNGAKADIAKAKEKHEEAALEMAKVKDKELTGHKTEAKKLLDEAAEEVVKGYTSGGEAMKPVNDALNVTGGKSIGVLHSEAKAVRTKIIKQQDKLNLLGGGSIAHPGSGEGGGKNKDARAVYTGKFVPAADGTHNLYESMSKTMDQAKVIADITVDETAAIPATEAGRINKILGPALKELAATSAVSDKQMKRVKPLINTSVSDVNSGKVNAGF